ncbi:B12-binding domain-containing radical SAM protein [Pelosinus baikalensis]|uniref:B12-binding domain-containing radical SAM protein n=1 Tax=Pelosinus baikalensis TaxID=2892015 RepID=A0ABS8HTK1_9FIRM|nr:radical SAM protein [Pelosinus baikalensis]MCC5466506.1 B12-binding domain-containing radical SAM protein [Pelosinus baikalensis]
MKRILLLVPKGNGPGDGKKWNKDWLDEMEIAVSKSLWRIVTPGALVLGSLADSIGHQVDLVDEEFQEVEKDKKFDIVAMYTVAPNAKRAYMWANYYRSVGTHVVLGGVHAAMCPEEAELHADTLLLGETEYIWPEFLKDFAYGKAKKRYTQALGKVDLNHSPAPAFKLLPPNGRRIIPVQTARGCPHGCRFCNMRSLYGKGYRLKNLDNVEKELQEVMKVNPRATIYFTDDNLFCDRARSKKMLEIIRSYGLQWYTNCDISFGQDEEFVKTAYRSGCRQVLIGFESVNPENLVNIDENNFKSHQFSNYKDAIRRIQSNGIGVVGSFIIGLDEDDKEVFQKTVDFACETNLFGASATVNTPYPGTVSFGEMRQQDRIVTYDWDMYTIFQPVIIPRKMTVEELNDGYTQMIKEINSPKNINRRLEYFKEQLKSVKGYG